MLGQRGSLPQRGFAVEGDPPRSQPAAKLLLLKKIQLKENIASYSQPRSYSSGYWPVIALFSLTEAKLPDCPLSNRNRDVFVSANGQRVARRNYFGARQAASPR